MKTYVKVDLVIDATGRDPIGPATVTVEDNKIAAIDRGTAAPEQGAQVVDLPGCTLLRGNPLEDIKNVRNVCFVMRNGKAVPDPEPSQAWK